MKVNYLISKITTTAIIVSSEIFPESSSNAWTMHLIIMLQTPMTHVSSTYFMNLQTKTTSLLLHRFMAAWSQLCGREDFTVLSQKSPDVDMFAYLQVSKRNTDHIVSFISCCVTLSEVSGFFPDFLKHALGVQGGKLKQLAVSSESLCIRMAVLPLTTISPCSDCKSLLRPLWGFLTAYFFGTCTKDFKNWLNFCSASAPPYQPPSFMMSLHDSPVFLIITSRSSKEGIDFQ